MYVIFLCCVFMVLFLLLISSISVNKSLLYTQGIQTPMRSAHSNNEEIFEKKKRSLRSFIELFLGNSFFT